LAKARPDNAEFAGDASPMALALLEARAAAARGEVPVGAVVTAPDGAVLARAGNETEARHDASAHAEMLVLRAAAAARRSTRLTGCGGAVPGAQDRVRGV
jgi:cytosine deaminase